MRIPIYQVDAFTTTVFKGNPAAVCPLESWLDDQTLQSIAAENNLSETAFFVSSGGDFHLRWFTPEVEVDLCGHATLAAAHVVFRYLQPALAEARFHTKSGLLSVQRRANLLVMNFPARPGSPCTAPDILTKALGGSSPRLTLLARDYLLVYESEQEVRCMNPDFNQLTQVKDCLGIIVTAPGTKSDFVSRFFAPNVGVPEDPVTGSAHSTLIPYWSERLKKDKLHALQLSSRGGELHCENHGDRVEIGGEAVTFLTGSILL